MGSDWQQYQLKEVAEIFDGPHATPAKTDSGPIFLGISNLANGRLNLSDAEYLSEEDFVRWTRRVTPQAGDIVFSYETRLGEAAIIPAGLRCCLGRRMGLLRPRLGQVDARFLLYAYLGPEFQQTLRSRTVPGSTVDRIPLIDMPEFPISVPTDIDEQRMIAKVLGTLDDKIELNRRMNETLETMAHAIFKSWFVDFDPVRAKAEGSVPSVPADCMDLFIDSFQDTELGRIPLGWRVGSIDEVCRRVAMGPFGSDIKTSNFIEVGVPVIRGGNLTEGFVDESFVFVSEQKADELRNANAFPGDIVITHRGTLGQVGLIPNRTRFPRYVVSQSQMLLSIDESVATPHFIFEYFCSPVGQHQLLANTSQTGVPAIARPVTSVKAIRLVLPPLRILRAFEELVCPLINHLVANRAEITTLVSLRDTLLPKLVCGELRVPSSVREEVPTP